MKISKRGLIAALILSAALLATRTAFAAGGGTTKVLVFDAVPDDVVAVFAGAHTPGPGATDPGAATVESATPAARDSRVTELFVPIGMTSAVWMWGEDAGYRFLTNVAPDDNDRPIVLDAQRAMPGAAPAAQEPAPDTAPVTNPSPPLPSSQQTVKVLVPNAAPGQIVAVFQGAFAPGPEGIDPGSAWLESTTLAAVDHKATELFVPTSTTSSVWIWDEATGYHFLGNVTPGDRSYPIELDATRQAG